MPAGVTRSDPYAGKILRFDGDGTVPDENRAASPVFAHGYAQPTRVTVDDQNVWLMAVEAGSAHWLSRLPSHPAAADSWPLVPEPLTLVATDAFDGRLTAAASALASGLQRQAASACLRRRRQALRDHSRRRPARVARLDRRGRVGRGRGRDCRCRGFHSRRHPPPGRIVGNHSADPRLTGGSRTASYAADRCSRLALSLALVIAFSPAVSRRCRCPEGRAKPARAPPPVPPAAPRNPAVLLSRGRRK